MSVLPIFFAAVASVVSASEQGDAADKCSRVFVLPKRIMRIPDCSSVGSAARSSVSGEDNLLCEKKGQIPETSDYASKIRGCTLVNNGNVPGFIVDFGRELHGGVQIGASCRTDRGMVVRLRFGESVSETCSDAFSGDHGAGNDHAIRDLKLAIPRMGTAEIGNTGFRFLRIDLLTTGKAELESVRAMEIKRDMKRLGSFRCSDERINRIWETAVRTVHLCCQNYIWDGIKRDRLVWMGDVHPETMVVLNVFGAADVLPESLDYMAATTDPKNEWMNCMGPYTLWWVRNVAEWYRFTGDKAYIERHHRYLVDTLNRLATFVTPSNTFEGVRRPFLDWPTEHNRPAVFSGMQALAALTFDDGMLVADALGDVGLAQVCRNAGQRLRKQTTLDAHGAKSAAAMLALAGLREPREMFADCLGRGAHRGVSTFYGYYMLEAMSAAGEDQRALDTVRDFWGGMLDMGATTFWEDFNLDWTNGCFRIDEMPVAGKKDIHGDFGEFCYSGFRHSLCHGWSGGPAAWCIRHVLGIRALEPGCRRIEVRPFLGDLDWAEGAMALPDGRSIKVRVGKSADGYLKTTIDAPDGIEIVQSESTEKTQDKVLIWPEGSMPNFQTNLYYKPFVVWSEPKCRKTDAVAIVCSGGGYNGSSLDGFELPPLRDYLLDKGMTVVSLRYRGPRPVGLPRHALAWQDAQRAVRIVRSTAPSRGLDPEKVGFAGFSAGGHLALLVATSSQTAAYGAVDDLDKVPCHVNWAVVVYPAYGFASDAERPGIAEANNLASELAPEFAFDEKTAPLCLIHGDRDAHSPMTSVRVYHRLRTMGIPCDLHVLAYEDHCFMKAAYADTGAASWKDYAGGWLTVMGLMNVHPNTRVAGWKSHHSSHWRGTVEAVADCAIGSWVVSDNNGFRSLADQPLMLRGRFGVCTLDFEYRMSSDMNAEVIVRGVRITLPSRRGEDTWGRATIWVSEDDSWTMAVDGEVVSEDNSFPENVSSSGRLGFRGHARNGVFAVRNVFTRQDAKTKPRRNKSCTK